MNLVIFTKVFTDIAAKDIKILSSLNLPQFEGFLISLKVHKGFPIGSLVAQNLLVVKDIKSIPSALGRKKQSLEKFCVDREIMPGDLMIFPIYPESADVNVVSQHAFLRELILRMGALKKIYLLGNDPYRMLTTMGNSVSAEPPDFTIEVYSRVITVVSIPSYLYRGR